MHHRDGRERAAREGRRATPQGVPSDRARGRLARDVRREVADLRVRLSEASLRSVALREAGFPGPAADAVAEQRALLADFQDRLDSALTAAVVEREAELVLAAEFARSAPQGEPRRLPATLGAALALAAALALVFGTGEELRPSYLNARDNAEPVEGATDDIPPSTPSPVSDVDASVAGDREPVAASGNVGYFERTASQDPPTAPPADEMFEDLLTEVEVEAERTATALEQAAGPLEEPAPSQGTAPAPSDEAPALTPDDDGNDHTSDEPDGPPADEATDAEVPTLESEEVADDLVDPATPERTGD